MSPVVSGTDGQRNSQSLPPRAIGSCTFFSRAIPLAGKIGLAHLDQSLHTNVGYLKSPKRRGTRVLLCDSIPSGTNCWKRCLPQITSEVPSCFRTAGDRHLRPRREISHPEHLVHRGLKSPDVHGAAAGDQEGVY